MVIIQLYYIFLVTSLFQIASLI